MVKALINYRVIKSYCCIHGGFAEFILLIKLFYLFVGKGIKCLSPHSASEIHRFAFSYCRSLSFHKPLGEIRGFYLLNRFRICFALV